MIIMMMVVIIVIVIIILVAMIMAVTVMMMIPIEVTLLGIVTDVSDVHPSKAANDRVRVMITKCAIEVKTVLIDNNHDDDDDDDDNDKNRIDNKYQI